ncbi:hypothetical protein F0562_001671 [Nyssa sinensis]|uniref:NB-ARC domain-containing protein n=1 Tax=Nyssa sinensis TaxID=561372 RepID=A0A5J5C7P5_9ASTE|nr:hypothetical protein F0562_001671 [Nyssa sinensis]
MAGLGKTTLAQLVYKDELVKQHFNVVIWVCVSDNFDVKKILSRILESFNMPVKETTSATTGNEVTTRKDEVASIMGTLDTHHLETLSEDDCWSVFKQRAFANGGPPMTPEFEAIGREVVRKCVGVPLAAKVLGGMMHSKKGKSEWLFIGDNEFWMLPDDNNGILRALKLSFNHLPLPSLKQCFAYWSIYPKDWIIEKDDLIQLWMAQGFLQPFERRNQEMEDVVSVTKYDCLILKDGEVNNISAVRHLTLISNEKKLPIILEVSAQKLRTLVLSVNHLGNVLKNFKYLRVLSLTISEIQELPSSIGKLKHLRYLEVFSTEMKALPDSITKLYNLQTLRLLYCPSLKELPKDFRKLISLRHLYMDNKKENRKLMPMQIGELTCRQTLPFFVVGKANGCHIEELGCLKKLRGELKIYHLEHVRNSREAQ